MTSPDVHEVPLVLAAVEHDDFVDGLEPMPQPSLDEPKPWPGTPFLSGILRPAFRR